MTLFNFVFFLLFHQTFIHFPLETLFICDTVSCTYFSRYVLENNKMKKKEFRGKSIKLRHGIPSSSFLGVRYICIIVRIICISVYPKIVYIFMSSLFRFKCSPWLRWIIFLIFMASMSNLSKLSQQNFREKVSPLWFEVSTSIK